MKKNIVNELTFIVNKEENNTLALRFDKDVTSYYLVQNINDEMISHEFKFYYIIDNDNSILEY